MSDNEKMIEELTKMRDGRANAVVQADPEWNRYQGMLDFAMGRIQLKAEEETAEEETTEGKSE